eukprot:snap_masked-scaffold_6-processed-gene-15.39-mRNA-1 protein AED:1.00 eAED:1.00 QI:0/-1/0/0/-1/1/1/0/839
MSLLPSFKHPEYLLTKPPRLWNEYKDHTPIDILQGKTTGTKAELVMRVKEFFNKIGVPYKVQVRNNNKAAFCFLDLITVPIRKDRKNGNWFIELQAVVVKEDEVNCLPIQAVKDFSMSMHAFSISDFVSVVIDFLKEKSPSDKFLLQDVHNRVAQYINPDLTVRMNKSFISRVKTKAQKYVDELQKGYFLFPIMKDYLPELGHQFTFELVSGHELLKLLMDCQEYEPSSYSNWIKKPVYKYSEPYEVKRRKISLAPDDTLVERYFPDVRDTHIPLAVVAPNLTEEKKDMEDERKMDEDDDEEKDVVHGEGFVSEYVDVKNGVEDSPLKSDLEMKLALSTEEAREYVEVGRRHEMYHDEELEGGQDPRLILQVLEGERPEGGIMEISGKEKANFQYLDLFSFVPSWIEEVVAEPETFYDYYLPVFSIDSKNCPLGTMFYLNGLNGDHQPLLIYSLFLPLRDGYFGWRIFFDELRKKYPMLEKEHVLFIVKESFGLKQEFEHAFKLANFFVDTSQRVKYLEEKDEAAAQAFLELVNSSNGQDFISKYNAINNSMSISEYGKHNTIYVDKYNLKNLYPICMLYNVTGEPDFGNFNQPPLADAEGSFKCLYGHYTRFHEAEFEFSTENTSRGFSAEVIDLVQEEISRYSKGLADSKKWFRGVENRIFPKSVEEALRIETEASKLHERSHSMPEASGVVSGHSCSIRLPGGTEPNYCDCCKPMLTGLPCEHQIALCSWNNVDINQILRPVFVKRKNLVLERLKFPKVPTEQEALYRYCNDALGRRLTRTNCCSELKQKIKLIDKYAPKKERQKRKYKCSICGELGHRKSRCGKNQFDYVTKNTL